MGIHSFEVTPAARVSSGKREGSWLLSMSYQRFTEAKARRCRGPEATPGEEEHRQSSDGEQGAVGDGEGAPRGSVCPRTGLSTVLSHGSFPRVTQVTARPAPKGFSPHRSSASALCAARWINNTRAGKTSGGFQVFIWTLEVTFS